MGNVRGIANDFLPICLSFIHGSRIPSGHRDEGAGYSVATEGGYRGVGWFSVLKSPQKRKERD